MRDIKQKKTDYILAKYIIKCLKNQGIATKDEISNYIKLNCNEIPDGYVDWIKVSKKSGKSYNLFCFILILLLNIWIC